MHPARTPAFTPLPSLQVLSLGRELESMRAGMGGMQAEIHSQIQRVASRVDQNEGFMAKIRETEVEAIQASS